MRPASLRRPSRTASETGSLERSRVASTRSENLERGETARTAFLRFVPSMMSKDRPVFGPCPGKIAKSSPAQAVSGLDQGRGDRTPMALFACDGHPLRLGVGSVLPGSLTSVFAINPQRMYCHEQMIERLHFRITDLLPPETSTDGSAGWRLRQISARGDELKSKIDAGGIRNAETRRLLVRHYEATTARADRPPMATRRSSTILSGAW